MTPPYTDDAVTLYHGDCLDVLKWLPDCSVNAVVTDPPYGLVFMGKAWDNHVDNARFGAWCLLWATECLRVLKPGGHLLAFGGSRTWHRLASAVEDAGFELRDSIAWLYGSGFPKSLDVSKAIDKAAGATREVVGTKKSGGASALNGNHSDPGPTADQWRESGGFGPGVAPITAPATEAAQQWQGWGTALKPAFEPIVVGRKPLTGTVAANVLEHGTGALNIDGCRVGTTDTLVRPEILCNDNEVYGKGLGAGVQQEPAGRWPTNVVLDESQAAELDQQTGTLGDSGGASRFFPVFRYEAKAPAVERPRDGEVAHPTVKPLDLMRWLVRLVTPPGGTVLEPFAGSGTTAEACVIEGFRCIAIEREADYLPLIVARLSKPIQMDLLGGGTRCP